MTANRAQYGIRFHSTKSGSHEFTPLLKKVASGYQAAVNGVTDTALALRPGDPVHALSTGYVQLAAGNEAAGNAAESVDGIIVSIAGYYDGEKMIIGGPKLPYNTVYGTVYERESQLIVCPTWGNYFEIDVDDASTATTYAAYLALVGEACDHRLKTGGETDGKAWPRLDISTHGASNGQWKIVGISKTRDNVDFAGANVKLIVEANEGAALV